MRALVLGIYLLSTQMAWAGVTIAFPESEDSRSISEYEDAGYRVIGLVNAPDDPRYQEYGARTIIMLWRPGTSERVECFVPIGNIDDLELQISDNCRCSSYLCREVN